MEEINVSEEIRKAVKEGFGMTEEDIDRLSPENKQIMSKMEDFGKYKIVAECIRSKYCSARIKVGHRIVFTSLGVLIPGESTSPFCMGALDTMMPYIQSVYSFIAAGLDPREILVNHCHCLDTGIEYGGVGRVTYKFHVEKVS